MSTENNNTDSNNNSTATTASDITGEPNKTIADNKDDISDTNNSNNSNSMNNDIKQQEMQQAVDNMMDKLSKYINGEIAASTQDYELLEKLNAFAGEKYKHMADRAERLVTSMNTLNLTYVSLKPYLDQIDELDNNITHLEDNVKHLDAYSKKLVTQFKKVYQ